MRVKLITRYAGPLGNYGAGSEVEFEDDLALSLIQGGYATPVRSGDYETALQSGRETATAHDRAKMPDAPEDVRPESILEGAENVKPSKLTDLDGVGPARARKLRELGIETPQGLADADPVLIGKILSVLAISETTVLAWIEEVR